MIQGMGNGRFEPNRAITREELATMLYRFANVVKADTAEMTAGNTLDYVDANEISPWSKAAVLYGQEAGFITGRDGGRFVPRDTATRAEVATMLQRFIEHMLK